MQGCFKVIVFAACAAWLGTGGVAIAGVCPPSSHLVMLPQGPACAAGPGAQAMGRNHVRRRGRCQAPNRVVRLPRGLYCLNPRQIAMLRQKFAELRLHQQQQQLAQQNAGRGPQLFLPSTGQQNAGRGPQLFLPSTGQPQTQQPAQQVSSRGPQVFMPSGMKVFMPTPMKPIGPPGPPSPTQANNASSYGTQVGNKIDPNHKGLNPAQAQWMNTIGHDMMNSGWSGSGWQYQ